MLLRIECDEIWVPKTSKMGESDAKCLPSRISARTTPRSVSSWRKSGRKAGRVSETHAAEETNR